MHPVERLTRYWKKRVRKEQAMSTNPQDGSQPTVVLVHGAWADGSGWQGGHAKSPTEYKEFEGRSHYSVIGGEGWEEVADYAFEWAVENAKRPAA
jgi:hypothetical protein